jgi:hypothetical protein
MRQRAADLARELHDLKARIEELGPRPGDAAPAGHEDVP